MKLELKRIKGKKTDREVNSLIIVEGTLTYYVNGAEFGVDLDNIDSLIVTDSPAPVAQVQQLTAEVARLKAQVQCTYCAAVFAIDNPLQFEHWRECDKHPARLEMEQLRAQVETMREALGPFADCAEVWEDSDRARVIHWSRRNVDGKPDLKITVDDLMTARAALGGE